MRFCTMCSSVWLQEGMKKSSLTREFIQKLASALTRLVFQLPSLSQLTFHSEKMGDTNSRGSLRRLIALERRTWPSLTIMKSEAIPLISCEIQSLTLD
ncbi:hypothetical protein E2320_007951, partial [Naja naja]